jgi:hypothetical protein
MPRYRVLAQKVTGDVGVLAIAVVTKTMTNDLVKVS